MRWGWRNGEVPEPASVRKPLARVHSRDVRITFRATEEEADELRADAAAEDVELSRLIRRRLSIARRMEQAMPLGKVAHA